MSNGSFLVTHVLAHNSTYSYIHPPTHTQNNTTQHNTPQHKTTQHNTTQPPPPHTKLHTQHTVLQRLSVTWARLNTITHSRTRPTSFKVVCGLGIDQDPCTLAVRCVAVALRVAVAFRCRWCWCLLVATLFAARIWKISNYAAHKPRKRAAEIHMPDRTVSEEIIVLALRNSRSRSSLPMLRTRCDSLEHQSVFEQLFPLGSQDARRLPFEEQ